MSNYNETIAEIKTKEFRTTLYKRPDNTHYIIKRDFKGYIIKTNMYISLGDNSTHDSINAQKLLQQFTAFDWKIKHFKTSDDAHTFMSDNCLYYEVQIITTGNGYAVEYRDIIECEDANEPRDEWQLHAESGGC
tara:strand:- start:1302 stop:1703 length:402 start_codon:yes stop_codon:yes gene_type:complete